MNFTIARIDGRPDQPAASRTNSPERDPRKWQAAQELEANFLAEMLDAAGLDDESASFGGGIGAEQFGSFLRQGQAEAMVRAGGIGLAEQFYNSLEKRDD